MAKQVSKITLGIDVAKQQLAICNWSDQSQHVIPNERTEIRRWLRQLHGPARIAVEPTAQYHQGVVEEALQQEIDVFLVDPRQLAHYREAVNVRDKTDPRDAWLLARYLAHEGEQLRAFKPHHPKAQRLWSLILRRATVVQARQQLQQSFKHTAISIQALVSQFNRLLQRLDAQIQALIRSLGWWANYRRCGSIPGVGPCTAAALVAAFHRGAFASSDAFVAFLGLDVRVRESGRFKGKRKLTKRGEAELRRLLYCASQGACSEPRFAQYRQRQLDKGLSKTAARVALGRKIARIAFSLMSNQQTFIRKANGGCPAA